MKLEVGRSYITRSGLSIYIVNKCNGTLFPYVGILGKSQFYYSDTGKFSGEPNSEFDLISPVFNVKDANEVISFVVSNNTLNDSELRSLLKTLSVAV